MELAVRIHDLGTLRFTERVKEWILRSEFIQAGAGSLEVGDSKRLHWQLALRITCSMQVFRTKLLREFPDLKGNVRKSSSLYSIGTCRKSWAVNICYCMKDITIPFTSGVDKMTVLKNVTLDEILAARVRYAVDGNKPTGKAKNYMQELVDFVRKEGATSDEDIILAMVEYHHMKQQIQPDVRFGYPRLLETIKLEMVVPENYEYSKINLLNKILRNL